jgi:hypothetical protein
MRFKNISNSLNEFNNKKDTKKQDVSYYEKIKPKYPKKKH